MPFGSSVSGETGVVGGSTGVGSAGVVSELAGSLDVSLDGAVTLPMGEFELSVEVVIWGRD